jgi:hypothetical protein
VPKTDLGFGVRPNPSQCRYLSKVFVDMGEGRDDSVSIADLLEEGGEGDCSLMRGNGRGSRQQAVRKGETRIIQLTQYGVEFKVGFICIV